MLTDHANKMRDAESTGSCMHNSHECRLYLWSIRINCIYAVLKGNRKLLDRPLPFKLHQSYRPLPRFIREFNPVAQEIWSGPAVPTVKPQECRPLVSGCMSAAGTGKQQFIEGTMNAYMYCNILKQSVIPSLRRLGRRAVFQNYNDHCPAKEAEGKGDGLAKHLSRPKPY